MGIGITKEIYMNRVYHFFIQCFTLLCLITLISACSKLTQTNFNKIQYGMSMKQVVAILGEPTNTRTFTFAGVSATSSSWISKGVEIDIQFLNDKVEIKSFNKDNLENNKPLPNENEIAGKQDRPS